MSDQAQCAAVCQLCDLRNCDEPAGAGHPHVCADCRPTMVPTGSTLARVLTDDTVYGTEQPGADIGATLEAMRAVIHLCDRTSCKRRTDNGRAYCCAPCEAGSPVHAPECIVFH